MARGRKRKAAEKQDEKVKERVDDEMQEEQVEDVSPPPKKGKRARISKPKAEPEYFEDKRNLEDLWKQVFPVGTEWDLLDSIYQYNWNFKNLEDAFDEGGVLHRKRVYIFTCTEPQLVEFEEEKKIICIPVVVAVVSPFPPSDKIGITSVQMETGEIVPMKHMKMDWVPYIPLGNRELQVERLKSEIYILSCTQRRKALKHLKEDRLKKFEYCLPYFYNPLKEDEEEQITVINIFFPIDPKPPVVCDFDWELDELEDFTNKLIEDLSEEGSEEGELPLDKKDAFMNHVKEEVRKQKKANKEAREARKKARQELGEDKKAALQNIRFYKFYPVASPDSPHVPEKALYISRYYGNAHEIL